MKVVLLVPDGVGIRNFLFSSFLDKLINKGHKVIIWHDISKGAINEIENTHHQKFIWYALPKYKEGFVERVIRDSTAYARLKQNVKRTGNKTIFEFWVKHKPKLKIVLLQHLSKVMGSLLGTNYNSIIKAEKFREELIDKNTSTNSFRQFIEKEKPDIIFCTHQRSVSAAPALLVARKLGVKTVTAIFSWDNIPKGRMTVTADKYAVWSTYMKNELSRFYPEIEKQNIVITGSPQFEFYKNESLYSSRDQFSEKYGLDINRKWICYSGDDQLTSPHDPLYVNDVLINLQKIDEKERPQLILRRAPVDTSGRYEYLKEKFDSDLMIIDPDWKRETGNNNFTAVYPAFFDVALLVNIAKHCDAVINVGSTMAHDFTQFNKPAFYINYDVVQDKNWTTDFIYKFQHFRSMDGLDPVGWINSETDILPVLKNINTGDQIENDRLKWFDRIHSVQTELSATNLVDLITTPS